MSDLSLSDLTQRTGDGRRRDHRRRKDRRRRRRRRTAAVLVVCLLLVGGAGYVVYAIGRPVVEGLFEPNDFTGTGTGVVQVQVAPGDTGRAIGRTLESAGVVKTAGAFVDVASADPRAASIQPGTYQLRSEMAASNALALLLDPASRQSLRVTVPEGLTKAETFAAAAEGTGLPADQLALAAADPTVGLPPEAAGDPEGYLFPATYDFEPDVTPVEVVTAMVARHGEAMTAVGVPVERRREILVKASLVEDEAQLPEDRPRVARVVENRLARGTPLQLDSTVNFATGKSGITTTEADRATDSPYNTYRYPGLPPGPVNSPGEAAIAAALNPEPGDWLFFVAVNPETGETRYATTEAEHAANVELFRQWLRENGGG